MRQFQAIAVVEIGFAAEGAGGDDGNVLAVALVDVFVWMVPQDIVNLRVHVEKLASQVIAKVYSIFFVVTSDFNSTQALCVCVKLGDFFII